MHISAVCQESVFRKPRTNNSHGLYKGCDGKFKYGGSDKCTAYGGFVSIIFWLEKVRLDSLGSAETFIWILFGLANPLRLGLRKKAFLSLRQHGIEIAPPKHVCLLHIFSWRGENHSWGCSLIHLALTRKCRKPTCNILPSFNALHHIPYCADNVVLRGSDLRHGIPFP